MLEDCLISNPCSKWSQLNQVPKCHIQLSIQYGDYTAYLGSLFQYSVTFQVKKLFIMFKWNFLYFIFCPFLLVMSLGTTQKSLAPSFLLPWVHLLAHVHQSPAGSPGCSAKLPIRHFQSFCEEKNCTLVQFLLWCLSNRCMGRKGVGADLLCLLWLLVGFPKIMKLPFRHFKENFPHEEWEENGFVPNYQNSDNISALSPFFSFFLFLLSCSFHQSL